MAMLSKIAKMKLYIIIHFLRQGFFIFLTINITIGFLFGSLNENKVIMLNGIRILIVEDDKLNQKIIKLYFLMRQYFLLGHLEIKLGLANIITFK